MRFYIEITTREMLDINVDSREAAEETAARFAKERNSRRFSEEVTTTKVIESPLKSEGFRGTCTGCDVSFVHYQGEYPYVTRSNKSPCKSCRSQIQKWIERP
jgi:hypothetical protein